MKMAEECKENKRERERERENKKSGEKLLQSKGNL